MRMIAVLLLGVFINDYAVLKLQLGNGRRKATETTSQYRPPSVLPIPKSASEETKRETVKLRSTP